MTPPYERPTAETDPGECAWCFQEAMGDRPCPYHGDFNDDREYDDDRERDEQAIERAAGER